MRKRVLPVLLGASFLCSCLAGLFWMYSTWQEEQTELNKLEELSALLVPISSPVPDPSASMPGTQQEAKPKSLAQLQARNPDCLAWLRIEGTEIDFPVMQREGEPDYYLHRNFDGENSPFGVPYLDARCTADAGLPASQNLILYGHTLSDGTMFTPLHHYEEKSYLAAHGEIELITAQEKQIYEVFAVMRIPKTVEIDEPNIFNFVDYQPPERFEETISFIRNNALYDTGLSAAPTDRFLTLTTCNTAEDDGLRLIVVGKLVL